jgi:hypothetical protein
MWLKGGLVTSRTGAYFAEQRRASRLTLGQLAAAIGYTNIAKGASRILALERDGVAVRGLLDKIINALGLDGEHVRNLVAEDRRLFEESWQRWATEPIQPELRRRLMAAVWGRAQMPTALSREDAVEFAKSRAVAERLTFVLVWSRREEIWCYPDGRTFVKTMEVGQAAGPFTKLSGQKNRGFLFGCDVEQSVGVPPGHAANREPPSRSNQ